MKKFFSLCISMVSINQFTYTMEKSEYKKIMPSKNLSIIIPSIRRHNTCNRLPTCAPSVPDKTQDPVLFSENDKNHLITRTLRHIGSLAHKIETFDEQIQEKIIDHLKDLRQCLSPLNHQRLYICLEDPFARLIIDTVTPYTKLLEQRNHQNSASQQAIKPNLDQTCRNLPIPENKLPSQRGRREKFFTFSIKEPINNLQTSEFEKYKDVRGHAAESWQAPYKKTINLETIFYRNALATLKTEINQHKLENAHKILTEILAHDIPRHFKKTVRHYGQQLISYPLHQHASVIALARQTLNYLQTHFETSPACGTIQTILYKYDSLNQASQDCIRKKIADHHDAEAMLKELPSILAGCSPLFLYILKRQTDNLDEYIEALMEETVQDKERTLQILKCLLPLDAKIKKTEQLIGETDKLIDNINIHIKEGKKIAYSEHITAFKRHMDMISKIYHIYLRLFGKAALGQEAIQTSDLETKSINLVTRKIIHGQEKALRVLKTLIPILTKEEDKSLVALIQERERDIALVKGFLI